VLFQTDSEAKSCIFATVLPSLLPFLLLALRGQGWYLEGYDNPPGLCARLFYDFPIVTGMVSAMFVLFAALAALRDIQSQALNSNFVARQVVVVKRAATLKFVEENIT